MKNLKTRLISAGLGSTFLLLLGAAAPPAAQDSSSHLRVNVDLVQLNIIVTDNKGHYIAGLKPSDFAVTEDKIPEKIATFEEGGGRRYANLDQPGALEAASDSSSDADHAADRAGGDLSPGSQDPVRAVAGTNVFILFDTSNFMYRSFVYAQDAIADFVRSLDPANRVAFYSYSRNLSRATPLTADRFRVVNGVRNSVAGDSAALYNCLLLTVKDASQYTGRKAIVVFSNGPDDASSVPPEDVAELAQSTGTIIYIVSTRQANQDPVSSAAFARVSKVTGGKAYFAPNWRDEKKAFADIREDIGHLYTVSYYPAPNPNRGWRQITVKLVGKNLQKYHIRTRDGYRLLQHTAITNESYAAPVPPLPAQ